MLEQNGKAERELTVPRPRQNVGLVFRPKSPNVSKVVNVMMVEGELDQEDNGSIYHSFPLLCNINRHDD